MFLLERLSPLLNSAVLLASGVSVCGALLPDFLCNLIRLSCCTMGSKIRVDWSELGEIQSPLVA